MKKFIIFIMLIFVSEVVFAETFILRTGKVFTGEVVSQNERKIILETANGRVSIPRKMIGSAENVERRRANKASMVSTRQSTRQSYRQASRQRFRSFYESSAYKQSVEKEKASAAARKTRTKKKTVNKDVTIYVTSWCGYCKKLEEYLKRHNIKYTKYDVEKDKSAMREFKALGGEGYPLVKIGSTVIKGYSPEKMRALLE